MFLHKAYAAATSTVPIDNIPGGDIGNRFKTLGNVLVAAINVVFYVALAVDLIFLILAGVKYATSGGDPKAAGQAKDSVTSAIIGLVIIVGFRVVLALVFSILGGNTPDIANIGF
jgi:hypothetical protein